MHDGVFHALADKQRRLILSFLKTRDMNVSELLSHLSVTGATLSHHLDILKRANLVTVERKGRFLWYGLNAPVFDDVLRHLRMFFGDGDR